MSPPVVKTLVLTKATCHNADSHHNKLARQLSMSYGQRSMSPLHTKTVFVAGKLVKVYSYDGKMWFSKGRDMTEFHERRRKVKTTIQASLGRWFKNH